MKKSMMMLLLLFFVLMLSACKQGYGKDYVFTNEVISKNLPEMKPSKIRDASLYEIEFPSTSVVETTYYDIAGLLIVQDEQNRKSCWSIFKNGYLFPFEGNITINLMSAWFGQKRAYYVKVTRADSMTTVYDCFGNVVVEPNKYNSIVITGEIKSMYLNEDENISEVYVETVGTIKYSDYINGITDHSIKQNIIDIETHSRQEFTKPTSGFS